MLKKIVILLVLLLVGCSQNAMVRFEHRNHVTPSFAAKMKTARFGVINIGDAIAGLKDAMQKDVSRYQGKQADVLYIQADDDHLARLKKGDFGGDAWKKYDADLIFVLVQKKPETGRHHTRQREGETVEDKRAIDKDRLAYTTTGSVNCSIYLFDKQSRKLFAKSSETLYVTDYFYNYLFCLEKNKRFSTNFFDALWLPWP